MAKGGWWLVGRGKWYRQGEDNKGMMGKNEVSTKALKVRLLETRISVDLY